MGEGKRRKKGGRERGKVRGKRGGRKREETQLLFETTLSVLDKPHDDDADDDWQTE